MTVTRSGKPSPVFWNVIKIIIALLLVGGVLSRTDREQFLSLLEHISLPWLAWYVVFFICLTLLKAAQYYYLIGGNISYPHVLNVVVMQNAVTNYFASSAGIVSYLALFRAEHGVKVGRSAVVFMLTKVGDLIIIWLTFCVSSLMVWHEIEVFHTIVVVLAAGIGSLLLVFFFTVLFRHRFISLLKNIMDGVKLSRFSIVQKGMGMLESLSEMELGRVVQILGIAFLLSTVYFIFTVAWIYASYRVFDFRPPPWPAVFIADILMIISYIPVQIFGGLGITETSALYFWGAFNVPQTELASMLIGIRIIFYLVNLLPLIYLPMYAVFFHPRDNPLE